MGEIIPIRLETFTRDPLQLQLVVQASRPHFIAKSTFKTLGPICFRISSSRFHVSTQLLMKKQLRSTTLRGSRPGVSSSLPGDWIQEQLVTLAVTLQGWRAQDTHTAWSAGPGCRPGARRGETRWKGPAELGRTDVSVTRQILFSVWLPRSFTSQDQIVNSVCAVSVHQAAGVAHKKSVPLKL